MINYKEIKKPDVCALNFYYYENVLFLELNVCKI